MKTPVDTVKGRIIDIDEHGAVTIVARYDDWPTLLRREYKECYVEFIDSRPLSDKQRRTCYMLLRAISDYTGMGDDPTKEWMKLKFVVEDLQLTADRMFSLSNAPMSLVAAFERFLVRFILDWDIPTPFSLLKFVDDVADYVYACAISKKCVVCGRHGEIHHIDRVGIGRDRHDIVHEGMETLPLCREHHTEIHTSGDKPFLEKYHIDGGVVLDKTLCKIWKLKARKDNGKTADTP